MKKPLEIDEALLAELERSAQGAGLSTDDFIENTLRAALPRPTPARFSQRTHDFEAHLDSPWTALVELEGEAYAGGPRKQTK